jgi:hypothetical protein
MTATLVGTVSGGGAYPLGAEGIADIYFFSDQAAGQTLIGGGLPAAPGGPDFEPIRLGWSGRAELSGRVVAVARFRGSDDGGLSRYLAQKPVTLSNGKTTHVDLALAPVPETHLAGVVEAPTGQSVGFKQTSYRLPVAGAVIGLSTNDDLSPAFDYPIPDLGALGGAPCMSAGGTTGFFGTLRCGSDLVTTHVALTLQPPPSLSGPADGALINATTIFAWTSFANGIYDLELQADRPSRAIPNLHVFTSSQSVTWSSLVSTGVSLPVAGDYGCVVSGLGPYATMDEALGPQGVSAPIPAEARWGRSPPIQLTVGP